MNAFMDEIARQRFTKRRNKGFAGAEITHAQQSVETGQRTDRHEVTAFCFRKCGSAEENEWITPITLTCTTCLPRTVSGISVFGMFIPALATRTSITP